jgi:Arc/MetJ family transcription regulator
MTQTVTANTLTIERNELSSLLREVVREVVREELERFAAQEAEWEIEKNSILWEDLTALQTENRTGTLKLLSHAEVFGK